jgi:hypothetical protein
MFAGVLTAGVLTDRLAMICGPYVPEKAPLAFVLVQDFEIDYLAMILVAQSHVFRDRTNCPFQFANRHKAIHSVQRVSR